MTCPSREQDLLFFAHNALGPISRLRVVWHLQRCSGCQARLGQLQSVSQQIAGAIRPAGLAAWAPPPSAGGIGALPIKLSALILLTALVLVLLTTAMVVGSHRLPQKGSPSNTSHTFGPCRPGLPNSRCR